MCIQNTQTHVTGNFKDNLITEESYFHDNLFRQIERSSNKKYRTIGTSGEKIAFESSSRSATIALLALEVNKFIKARCNQ